MERSIVLMGLFPLHNGVYLVTAIKLTPSPICNGFFKFVGAVSLNYIFFSPNFQLPPDQCVIMYILAGVAWIIVVLGGRSLL